MKGYSKKLLLIVAGAAIGIGVILSAAGLVMADFDLDRLTGREEIHFSGDYPMASGLAVDIGDVNLRFSSGPADQIHITGEGMELTVDQRADGTLSVQEVKKSRKWYELVMIGDWKRPEVEIVLPESFQGELQVEQGYGSLEIEGPKEIAALKVEKKDGRLRLASLSIAGSCILRQDYGSVFLERVKTERLQVDRKDGSLELLQTDVTGDLALGGSYGKTRLEEVAAANCQIDGKGMDVTLRETRISGDLKVYVDYGDLSLERTAAGLLECDIKDGDVIGTLLGAKEDYRASVEIKDGKSNLETRHEGKREIKIHIDYGSVRLDFSAE